jgi:hypothetical protein
LTLVLQNQTQTLNFFDRGAALATVSPKSDQVSLLALMAQANAKLECLLAQSTDCALHLLGDFNNRRTCLRVRLQGGLVPFSPQYALRNLLRLCHAIRPFVFGMKARTTYCVFFGNHRTLADGAHPNIASDIN